LAESNEKNMSIVNLLTGIRRLCSFDFGRAKFGAETVVEWSGQHGF